VEAARGLTTQTLLRVISAQQAAVETLAGALTDVFDTHPLAPVLRSAPGLGLVLGARVLAEVGDDPTRFATPAGLLAYAGTAPVTRASRRSRYVKAGKIGNRRLGDACHWWAFAMLTKSPGAHGGRAHGSSTTGLVSGCGATARSGRGPAAGGWRRPRVRAGRRSRGGRTRTW